VLELIVNRDELRSQLLDPNPGSAFSLLLNFLYLISLGTSGGIRIFVTTLLVRVQLSPYHFLSGELGFK
jgi:hypothetical protein